MQLAGVYIHCHAHIYAYTLGLSPHGLLLFLSLYVTVVVLTPSFSLSARRGLAAALALVACAAVVLLAPGRGVGEASELDALGALADYGGADGSASIATAKKQLKAILAAEQRQDKKQTGEWADGRSRMTVSGGDEQRCRSRRSD